MIIHKAISPRPKDSSDIEGIVAIQGENLDNAYITQWLTEFSLLLEKPILERYEQIVNM